MEKYIEETTDNTIVKSGNVYISDELKDQLSLLQFTHFSKFDKASFKPSTMKLQLQFTYQDDQIILNSNEKPLNSRYFCGLFKDNDLILHEIDGIYELKPKVKD